MTSLWTHLAAIDSALAVAFAIGVQGLALLCTGALALLLGLNQRLALSLASPAPDSSDDPRALAPSWFWFGWFNLGKGLAILVTLASGTTAANLSSGFFTTAFLAASLPAWLAAAWFVWTVWCLRRGRAAGSPPWLLALLVIGLIAFVTGLPGLAFLNRLLAAVVGLALVATLLTAPRAFALRHRRCVFLSLTFIASGLLGLAALEVAVPAYQNLLPGWTLQTFAVFEQRAFAPVFLGLGFAFLLSIGWWFQVRLHAVHRPAHRWLGRALWLVPTALAVTGILGFGAVNFIKVRGAERADLAYARRAHALVAGLDLAGWRARAAADLPGLARALDHLAAANPDIEAFAYAEMRAGRLHVLAASACSAPLPARPSLWREYASPDPRFTEATAPFSSSFMQDAHGTYTLFCEPWPAPGRGWLVFRVSSLHWSDVMGPVLVQASLIVLLGCLASLAIAIVLVQRALTDESRLDLARATASDQAKTELLTLVSHELRTPIQGILGYTTLLERSTLAARQRDWIDALRSQGDHLLRLVNDLLDFGALQTGRLALQLAPLAPARVARSALAAIRPLAEARGLACTLDLDPSTPAWVLGDATRLRQILVNLLGNAVKFTPSGRITLRLETAPATPASPAQLVFSVTDTGVGIAPADLPHLFEPRAHAVGRTEEGAGLGLALTRSLCLAMRGTLTVASEPGRGSTFTVRLALRETAPPPGETVAPASASPLPAFAFPPPPPGLRVLVVEDNTALRALLAAWLLELGCTPTLVPDGEAALATVARAPFDVVLLDLGLPGMDGLAVARALLTTPPAHPPRLIGLSAHASAADRAAALAAGMQLFLTKPVELSVLAAALTPPAMPASTPDPEPAGTSGLLATRLLPADQIAALRALASSEIPERLARLYVAHAAADRPGVATHAHYLANTADVLGHAELRAACLACETAAHTATPAALTSAIARLTRLVP